jgi:protein-disulfide isomerase
MKRLAMAAAILAAGAAVSARAQSKGKTEGRPNAPITIEVFSDFQCPGCKELHEQILPPLQRDYVETGKVYLVFRDFPLPMHAYSWPAAQLATAAERIGKYRQAADALFRNQTVWAASGKPEETVASVLTPAEMTKVRALAKEPGVVKEVQTDFELARSSGVNATPTMVVKAGGTRYPLPWPVRYEMLQRFLDGRLKK